MFFKKLLPMFILFFCFSATASSKSNSGTIGVILNNVDGKIIIIGLIPDGPADRAGIKIGYRLIGVDDDFFENKKINKSDFEKIVNKIRGPVGSIVKLTVLYSENHGSIEFNLKREIINEDDFKKALIHLLESARDNGLVLDASYNSVWDAVISLLSEFNVQLELMEKESGFIQSKEKYVTRDINGLQESLSEPKVKPIFDVKDFMGTIANYPSKKALFLKATWFYVKYRYSIDIKKVENGTKVKINMSIFGWNSIDGLTNLESKGSLEYSFFNKLQEKIVSMGPSPEESGAEESPNSCYDLCGDLVDDKFKDCMIKCKNASN